MEGDQSCPFGVSLIEKDSSLGIVLVTKILKIPKMNLRGWRAFEAMGLSGDGLLVEVGD